MKWYTKLTVAFILALLLACGAEPNQQKATPVPSIEDVYATANAKADELATRVQENMQYPTVTPGG